MRENLSLLLASLRERGWTGTFLVIFSKLKDLLFDIKYGTDTRGWVGLEELNFSSENKSRGTQYQPTGVTLLRYAFDSIQPSHESVFIDLGCGKGRVLLLAYLRGFKRVVGVEFSPQLCQTAKENIEIFGKKLGRKVDIEIHQSDVTDYPWQDDEDVIFMFNPFDPIVLDKVLSDIQSSFIRRPRRGWIVYVNPRHQGLFDSARGFELVRETKVLGDRLSVFEFAVKGNR